MGQNVTTPTVVPYLTTNQNQIFIMLVLLRQNVNKWRDHLRSLASGQQLQKNKAAVPSCWRQSVRFDQSGNQTKITSL